jgi:hypothetical protein
MPIERLDLVASAIGEDKERIAKQIQGQLLLDQRRQPID